MTSDTAPRELRQPYSRIIIPDEEGRYAAEVLEFPGCFSDGDTPEQAYTNLEEAAANWVQSAREQGMMIPAPFASQGFSGTVSLRLPKSLHRRATELAQRDGVSLNQFLVTAIAARVGAEDATSAIASRLDKRLDRLAGPLFIQGVALPIGTTLGDQQGGSWQSVPSGGLISEAGTPAYTTRRGELLLQEERNART